MFPPKIRRQFRLRGLTRAIAPACVVFAALTAQTPFSESKAQTLDDLAQAAQGKGEAVFGAVKAAHKPLATLPSWQQVVRQTQEENRLRACLKAQARCTWPHARAWRKMALRARDAAFHDKLRRVNAFFNDWPHRTDQANYGASDRWAGPVAFMRRSGDCEDYAVAKYFTLRALGVDPDRLNLVVVQDRIRRLAHAVLAVARGDGHLILDSQAELVFAAAKYDHYRPLAAMNERKVVPLISDGRRPAPTRIASAEVGA